MKKLVLVLAIVFAGVMSANAQVWVGLNNIGAQIEKNHTAFSVAPEVGYTINKQWTIALGVGYNYDQTKMDILGVETKVTNNTLFLQPYVRYVGGTIGKKFSLFADLCGDFGLLDANGAYAVTLQPGIAWNPTEKFTAAFRFCKIGYDHNIYGTDGFLLEGALACPRIGIYYNL
ncbi:MAG: hypothetical protein II887_01630 [Bacteroidales bacterium]|nr:hypothetical protein [Bacteroidales bacterium]